jgi:hypothetical protein
MDSSFTIKPRPGVQKFSTRDPVPVRAVDTELDALKSVAATADSDTGQREQRQEHQAHQEHTPHDLVADPESREVIYRENDVRAHADDRPHPDQALLRFRAYRPALAESDTPPDNEPHANIKA